MPTTVISWMPRYALSTIDCQFSRPFASSAKLPLPPSWPVSVAPAAYPWATGPRKLPALPPENPPPPLPRNRPFQFVTGRPMKILTRSTDGGCVTVAVTRHEPSEGSSEAESMVVLRSETLARLSHAHTGAASGKSGLGGVSAATKVIAPESAVTRRILLIGSGRPRFLSFMAELFSNKPENCNSTADKRSADSCNRRSAAVSAGPAAAAGLAPGGGYIPTHWTIQRAAAGAPHTAARRKICTAGPNSPG